MKRKISTEGQKMYVNAILPKKVMDHRCKKSSMTTGLQDLLLPSDPVIPNSADVYRCLQCSKLHPSGLLVKICWDYSCPVLIIKACKWPWNDEHKPHKRSFAVKICFLTWFCSEVPLLHFWKLDGWKILSGQFDPKPSKFRNVSNMFFYNASVQMSLFNVIH